MKLSQKELIVLFIVIIIVLYILYHTMYDKKEHLDKDGYYAMADNLLNNSTNFFIRERNLLTSGTASLGTFNIPKEYILIFEVNITATAGNWQSLLHFSHGREDGTDGSRIPGIWIYPNTTDLHVMHGTTKPGNWNWGHSSVPALILNNYSKVIIIANATTHSVYVDGVLKSKLDIPSGESLSINQNAKVYAPDAGTTSALIKNVNLIDITGVTFDNADFVSSNAIDLIQTADAKAAKPTVSTPTGSTPTGSTQASTPVTSTQASADKNKIIMIGVIACCCCLSIIGIIVFIMMKKKTTITESATTDSGAIDSGATDS